MTENSNDSTFRAQLAERISRWAKQVVHDQEKVNEWQDTLDKTRQRLEMASEMYRLEFGEEPSGVGFQITPSISETPPRQRRRGGDSWNASVLQVLHDAGRPLRVKEIWEHLQQGGFETGAQDPQRALSTVLVRLPGIVRTAPGTYGLKEQVAPTPQPPLERAPSQLQNESNNSTREDALA